ncbi:MAG: hypothetical protein J5I53_09680 [Bradyrhizobiaceae bacterium]|nr:hypothetical protein [Bradyrhizobiaceae bacterium]
MQSVLRLAIGIVGLFLSTQVVAAQTLVSQHLLLVDPTTGHMIKLEVPALTGPFTVTMPSSAGTLMTTTSGWALGGNNLGTPGPTDNRVGTTSNHDLVMVAGNDPKLSLSSTASDPIKILDGTGLAFQDADESNVSSFTPGDQSADIRYTLPTTQPATNTMLTATAVSGSGPYDVTLAWTAPTSYKEMAANESTTSNSVYEQLDALDIAVEANTTYIMEMYLFNQMSSIIYTDVQFTFPSGVFTVGGNVGFAGPFTYNGASPVTLSALRTQNHQNIVKMRYFRKLWMVVELTT